MKRFLTVLLVVVVLFTATIPTQKANADGLTLAAIAGGVYAIALASGMHFAFTGYDGLGVSQWMQNRINSWLAGRTIAEKFGNEVIRLTSGKLLIPSAAVAGIVEFLGSLKTETGLQENATQDTSISLGLYNGQTVFPYSENTRTTGLTPFNESLAPRYQISQTGSDSNGGVWKVQAYDLNGNLYRESAYTPTTYITEYRPLGYYLSRGYYDTELYVKCVFEGKLNGEWSRYTNQVWFTVSPSDYAGTVGARIPGAYSPPESLNDLQSWEGTVANAPDTNIGELLEDIFDQSAAGTLDVTGEVVDTPAEPQVTPVPTAAPGDVIGGLDTISGQLEGIDNALSGVHEGVGEAVGQLEGINDGVGSISEAIQPTSAEEAPSYKFDLTTLFPFCIPFDIYRFITMFNADPVAPHVQIPFNVPALSLNYTFDLDFSSFDTVAATLRSVELIAYCIGLAILTGKVIRW